MVTHSSVLAWRIPGTAEPGGLPSMGSHRVGHYWSDLAAAAAHTFIYWCCCLVAKSCSTLCHPMDFSPWGSSVHGILQARILEWVAMPCSNVSSQPMNWAHALRISRRTLYHWATSEPLSTNYEAHPSLFYVHEWISPLLISDSPCQTLLFS